MKFGRPREIFFKKRFSGHKTLTSLCPILGDPEAVNRGAGRKKSWARDQTQKISLVLIFPLISSSRHDLVSLDLRVLSIAYLEKFLKWTEIVTPVVY